MFAVGLMGGLMPRWCGEAGGSPALSRNRDHHCVWESGYQITWGVPDHVGVVWGSVAGYGVGIDA